ncbi:MAG: hypothetical protein HFG68_12210 [Hungatella sp.]|nr:hypothetical protein [Hungatella sp.]
MNYMKEKLDEIKFRVPKGQKSAIRKYAEKQGEKLTPFIIRAINETIDRDNQKQANRKEVSSDVPNSSSHSPITGFPPEAEKPN